MTDERPTYWLDLFTWQTWQEFNRAGGRVSGWREGRRNVVRAMRQGDILLCYLTGVSRFIGALEVTSEGYRDEAPIWSEEVFPWRVKVRPILTLTPETAVPVHGLLDRFSWFGTLSNTEKWTGAFRGSPARWARQDGELVMAELRAAAANPQTRSIDKQKLRRKARVWSGRRQPVTIPPKEPEAAPAEPQAVEVSGEPAQADESSAHTEMQYLLLHLGSAMGLSVWVARNDRGREFEGKAIADIPNLRDELPRQFDEETSRTIRLIDVLWLKRDSVVAAFEIEKSTSIYSGLLRMADLVALQPNINIPLYIVAPDNRRAKVREEINRPVFSRALDPPLSSTCRYIAFDRLRSEIARVGSLVKHLKPDFIHDLSEDCSVG